MNRAGAFSLANRPGLYDLELDCVAHEVTWFAQVGTKPARLHVEL